jgi:polyvinyl alcohol dehydrogenase (cytochrome)
LPETAHLLDRAVRAVPGTRRDEPADGSKAYGGRKIHIEHQEHMITSAPGRNLIARRLPAVLVAGLALLTYLVMCAAGADWPMINHDAANTRYSTETSITASEVGRLRPVLTLTAGGDVWTTPIVAGGAVYFPDSGGKLSKVDARTGKAIWAHSVSEYDGVTGATSRGSPAFVDGMIIIGDRNGAHVVAIDASTGDRRWIAQIDTSAAAIITGSPIVVGDRLYVGVSSNEGSRIMADRNYKPTFRGSIAALDIHTGKVQWKTYTLPEKGDWTGGAVMSVPAASAEKGIVYFGTDHQYTMPDSVNACLNAAPNDWDFACMPADARFDAVTALNLATGTPRWTFFGAGADVWKQACGELPHPSYPFPTGTIGVAQPVRVCPPVNDYLNWAFAAGSPQLFKVSIGGRSRDVLGMAQKSGVYWLFDADTGAVIWHTLIGPYSEPGGLTWGAAYDGQRLYVTLTNIEHVPFIMASGKIATGGAWSALDPATGRILWQTADPQNAADYAAPMVANGVVYVGSMATSGDQMYALDAVTGRVLWQFEAGASVASHPALVDGRLYWGSGFGQFGGKSGNKLYVFSIDGK